MARPYSICPTCGGVLNVLPLLDIYASAYACPGNHRFLRYEKEISATETGRAATLAPATDATDDTGIIEYWLGNESVRSCLNNQLAEILQNIYWSGKPEEHLKPEGETFMHCPLCGNQLNVFEQDDVWVQGKRCGNGHEFYERGGRLNFTVDGEIRHLVCEMSEEVLAALIKGWLKANPQLAAQLPRQVRGVLERFRH